MVSLSAARGTSAHTFDRRVVRETVALLPGDPRRALELLGLFDDPRTSAAQLSAAVEAEPCLRNRVLRAANSPFYRRERPVERVQQAVVLLGFATIRALAATTVIEIVADRAAGAPPGTAAHVSSAAVATSVAATHLGADATHAFAMGMLHDIGRVVFHRFDPRRAAAVAATGAAGYPLAPAERRWFGTTHQEVGAVALEGWGFPAAVAEAVLHHHDADPDGPPALGLPALGQRPATGLTHALQLGLDLAAMVEPERSGEPAPSPTKMERLAPARDRAALADRARSELLVLSGVMASQGGRSWEG